jgi:hypothetical protein
MGDDTKILTTQQLRELAAKAEAHGFKRQLRPEVLARLDDTKYHIARLQIFDFISGNNDHPMHHRVMLLLGTTNSRDAREGQLDISDEDWAALPDAEAVRAAVREAGEV